MYANALARAGRKDEAETELRRILALDPTSSRPCPLAVDTHLEGVFSSWELKMTKRHRRKFSDEFKAETVKLIRTSGRTVGSVARELNIGETAIRRWVNQAEALGSADSLSSDERTELHRLRKENRELRMEKEILAKATAFFAKESR
jgi:transposase